MRQADDRRCRDERRVTHVVAKRALEARDRDESREPISDRDPRERQHAPRIVPIAAA